MTLEPQKFVTVNSRKFDLKIHRSWKAELLEETADYWVLYGVFDEEITHPKLGVIRRKTGSYEYYWKEKWFNIFRFHEPDGALRNFYCNINMPPKLTDNVLDYIDLDIDLVVWRDFSTEILDLDEFEENSEKFAYSREIRVKCNQGIDELYQMIAAKSFPFSDF